MKNFRKTLLTFWVVFILGMLAREYGFPFFRVILMLLIVGAVWQLGKLIYEPDYNSSHKYSRAKECFDNVKQF